MKIKILWDSMKWSQFCFILIVVPLSITKVCAQAALSNIGAANESFGGRVATATGEWGLWGNPAGIASADNIRLGFGIGQQQGFPLATHSALVALPLSFGVFASGVSRFGDDLYNEQVLSIAYANRIELTTLGIRADVFQLAIDGHAPRRAIGITIGGIISAGKHVKIGATARNINLPEWQRDEKLPVVLNAGISFQPTDEFTSMIEVEKNTDLDPTYKAGFEYCLRKKFWLRTGVSLIPNAAFGGLGFSAWRIIIDYSMRYATLPGYHHQLSVSSVLSKRKRSS